MFTIMCTWSVKFGGKKCTAGALTRLVTNSQRKKKKIASSLIICKKKKLYKQIVFT